MSKPSPGSQVEPSQIGCRTQMMLLVTFVLLFLAACWLVGMLMANSL